VGRGREPEAAQGHEEEVPVAARARGRTKRRSDVGASRAAVEVATTLTDLRLRTTLRMRKTNSVAAPLLAHLQRPLKAAAEAVEAAAEVGKSKAIGKALARNHGIRRY